MDDEGHNISSNAELVFEEIITEIESEINNNIPHEINICPTS